MLGDKFVSTIHSETYEALNPTQWDLFGKVVLITGSSRGIGRSIAVSYARAKASGIVITGRNAESLAQTETAIKEAVQSMGGRHPTILKLALDVTDNSSVLKAERSVREVFGKLDILVNNAAYLGTNSKITEADTDDWWLIWTTNVRGPYLVTRAFLPLLSQSEAGDKTIVNINSIGAHLITPGISAYQVSKHISL